MKFVGEIPEYAFIILILAGYTLYPFHNAGAGTLPFASGEKLTYVLRWENIPAGHVKMEIRANTTVNGMDALHFVMTTRTNGLVDIFFKLRERIDAYADTRLEKSLLFKKVQTEGQHKRDERIEFDWDNGTVQHANFGKKSAPVELKPGSLDPLSIFYYTRVALSKNNPTVERQVTDGKKSFLGRATIIKRETIALSNGKSYDTLCIVPHMGDIGGVFQENKDAKIHIWVTDDEKRIPVKITSKLAIGRFIGELTFAEGL